MLSPATRLVRKLPSACRFLSGGSGGGGGGGGGGASFALTAEQQELQGRVAEFIQRVVVPFESDARRGSHGIEESLRDELIALARAKGGLLSSHVAPEWGGLGHDHRTKAIVFEEAGYSLLGPHALNINAPDEGNAHMLQLIGTAAQQERYLRPLGEGRARSCFCMTEPSPGAGSDPSALRTTARRLPGGRFVISGTKWLITGANGAAFAIIMAQTVGRDGATAEGATMFICPMQTPGIEVTRTLGTLDGSFAGGHCEVRFEGLELGEEDVLGEVGQGFKYAQVRLAPARLTHCFRWLGAARRAHDTALAYACERESFGSRLIDHQGVGFQLADNEMDMHVARLAMWHAAWSLDQGSRGGRESSVAKVLCSEAIYRVVDRSMQVLGGRGLTSDTEVERIFRDVRAFRVYDGTSEVHRMSLARRMSRANRPAASPSS
jgi:acyl-CoA dehydrogenase